MSTQAEADKACERACANAYAKALAKAYAEASEACTKIRKAHEACAEIRKAYAELKENTSPQAQPAQQSAVRGEPNHVEDVLAMVELKIGCVNHDCDKCKAASERKTYYGDRIILGQGGEPNIVIPEGMKDYTPQAKPKGNP